MGPVLTLRMGILAGMSEERTKLGTRPLGI
jgi:hypothetical protein